MTCNVLRMLTAVPPEHKHMLDLLTVLSGLHGKLVSFEAEALNQNKLCCLAPAGMAAVDPHFLREH